MFVALAALLLQLFPAQPIDDSAARAEKPAVVASVSAASAESVLVPPAISLPLADLRLRSGMSLLISTPDGPAVSLPNAPEPARAATASNADGAFIAAVPHPVRRGPAAAGVVSVFELQGEVRRQKRIWFALAAVEHGAAAFDAWTTRRAINNGGQELNPLMKPFANSGAIYAATQAGPLLFDFLGKRMMTSRSPMLRRLWWLPQLASTASSLFSGAHNLTVHP